MDLDLKLASQKVAMKIDERFRVPEYVDEGTEVLAPYRVGNKLVGLRCVVTVAAGHHARVENAERAFARWFHIDALRIDHGEEAYGK